MSKKNEIFFKEKRIWSEVKDDLLACYFKPYVFKILHTHKPLFYVDCFAGKGKFEDGKQGSPLIALNIIEQCTKNTKMNEKTNIKCAFIELNHAKQLAKNLEEKTDIQIISGKYEDNIKDLLHNKKKQNIFLYIDPYGIKALDCYLFDEFAKSDFNSIELLINLNSFGFIREACRTIGIEYNDIENFDDVFEYEPTLMDSSEQSIQDLNRIAGGDYWRNIVEDYRNKLIDGYEAEIRFSTEYCNRVRESYNYVLNMPIRLKEGQRPKYRMIHATNHQDGCVLMYDNICKRWEALNNIQTEGQISLFDMTIENQTVDLDDVKKKIKKHIQNYKDNIRLNVFLAIFYSEYGILCTSAEIRKILKELDQAGQVIITRNPAHKEGKPTRFFTDSTDQKIWIRSTT